MSTNTSNTVRPTKKQRELLSYIEQFIVEHGYSPSYREIMNGLNYTSVATVSLHVTSLIRRGHLRKRDRSARSLEVVADQAEAQPAALPGVPSGGEWLVCKVRERMDQAEASDDVSPEALAQLDTLLAALQLVGLAAAAAELQPRYEALANKEDA